MCITARRLCPWIEKVYLKEKICPNIYLKIKVIYEMAMEGYFDFKVAFYQIFVLPLVLCKDVSPFMEWLTFLAWIASKFNQRRKFNLFHKRITNPVLSIISLLMLPNPKRTFLTKVWKPCYTVLKINHNVSINAQTA